MFVVLWFLFASFSLDSLDSGPRIALVVRFVRLHFCPLFARVAAATVVISWDVLPSSVLFVRHRICSSAGLILHGIIDSWLILLSSSAATRVNSSWAKRMTVKIECVEVFLVQLARGIYIWCCFVGVVQDVWCVGELMMSNSRLVMSQYNARLSFLSLPLSVSVMCVPASSLLPLFGSMLLFAFSYFSFNF